MRDWKMRFEIFNLVFKTCVFCFMKSKMEQMLWLNDKDIVPQNKKGHH